MTHFPDGACVCSRRKSRPRTGVPVREDDHLLIARPLTDRLSHPPPPPYRSGEPWLTFDGISGTSAGAMNAAVMASGAQGGAAGARAALEAFWKVVSDASKYSPMRRGPLEMLTGKWTLENSPIYMAGEMMSRIFSPYDLNPFGGNPLGKILAETVDFKLLARSPIKLFITATNVRTGAGRVFRNAEITPDVLLASGCLPTMFKAVEIDGESYWDGGYVGNPTITPLVRECDSHDTILVQINPIERPAIPRSARDIHNRLNEVAFNAPLLKELRMIALLHKVADAGRGEGVLWANMRSTARHRPRTPPAPPPPPPPPPPTPPPPSRDGGVLQLSPLGSKLIVVVTPLYAVSPSLAV